MILLAGLAWSAKRLAGLGPPTDPGLRVTGRACLAAGFGGEVGDVEDGDFAPAQVDQATVSELPEGFGAVALRVPARAASCSWVRAMWIPGAP